MAAPLTLAAAAVTGPTGQTFPDVSAVVHRNVLTLADRTAVRLRVEGVIRVERITASTWDVHVGEGGEFSGVYHVVKVKGGCGCGGGR